jgi:hypothetical protein
MSTSKRHPKTKFSATEDFILNRCVSQFGADSWQLVAAFLVNRTPRQCKERWIKYLCPMNSFTPFTPDEDRQLLELYATYGSKWTTISRFFTNRTDITLKNRWLVLKRQERKTQEEKKSESRVVRTIDWGDEKWDDLSGEDLFPYGGESA